MSTLLEQGRFNAYSVVELNNAVAPILEHSRYSSKTTVFISHKHDEIDDLKGVLGFLERKYNVKAYIDSRDTKMPRITSAETAMNLKNRISKCDRFILIATNGAVESKWCNWELGFGDANNYPDRIAIRPMKPKGANDSQYKGSEYLRIYPYIVYSDGNEFNGYGQRLKQDYYVVTNNGENRNYKSLGEWLSDLSIF